MFYGANITLMLKLEKGDRKNHKLVSLLSKLKVPNKILTNQIQEFPSWLSG